MNYLFLFFLIFIFILFIVDMYFSFDFSRLPKEFVDFKKNNKLIPLGKLLFKYNIFK